MIIKGGTRAGGADLGVHLNRTDTNERVRLLELRGVAGVNLDQALREMGVTARSVQNRTLSGAGYERSANIA